MLLDLVGTDASSSNVSNCVLVETGTQMLLNSVVINLSIFQQVVLNSADVATFWQVLGVAEEVEQAYQRVNREVVVRLERHESFSNAMFCREHSGLLLDGHGASEWMVAVAVEMAKQAFSGRDAVACWQLVERRQFLGECLVFLNEWLSVFVPLLLPRHHEGVGMLHHRFLDIRFVVHAHALDVVLVEELCSLVATEQVKHQLLSIVD